MRGLLSNVFPERCTWSLALAAALALHAGLAAAATPPVTTTWLDNGLRVVRAEVPNANTVSIRLLVEDGTLRVPAARQHIPHLVEHLCALEMSASGDIDNPFRQGGLRANAGTDHFAIVYDFDAPSALGPEVVAGIRRQWDQPFDTRKVRREAERVRHEVMAHAPECALMEFALDNRTDWPLERARIDHIEALASVRPERLWAHFRRTHVGMRMTLVVAGSAAALRALAPEIETLSEIPAGTPAPPARYGDLSWLTGAVGSSNLLRRNLVGYRLPVSKQLDAVTRLRLQSAAITYINDRLAREDPVAYGIDLQPYSARDAEVWICEAYTDFVLDSRAEVYDAAEAAFEWLASHAAQPWWRSFVSADDVTNELWATDPIAVADLVVATANLTPRDAALPEDCVVPRTNADSLYAIYRDASRTGAFFKLTNTKFSSLASMDGKDNSEAEEPFLVLAVWLLAEWAWEHQLSFQIVTVLSTILLVLLVTKPPRHDRSTPSFRLHRVPSSAP